MMPRRLADPGRANHSDRRGRRTHAGQRRHLLAQAAALTGTEEFAHAAAASHRDGSQWQASGDTMEVTISMAAA